VRRFWWAVFAVAVMAVAACSGNSAPEAVNTPTLPAVSADWAMFRHLAGVLDFTGPRRDGAFVMAAGGRLFLLSPSGAVTPFARGVGGYQTPKGPEPYLVLSREVRVAGQRCSFTSDTVFAIQPGSTPGIIMISAQGRARRFASLPSGHRLSGIAFDGTGRFGYRLLVSAEAHGKTTVYGIGCDGGVATVATGAPPMEGGLVVAPATFGKFAGDLIAPNETSGRVYAVSPSGQVTVLAESGLPAGGDIGVESAGFVPPGATAAYLADRLSPGNRHPGDDAILRLSKTALERAGILPGDLLVASEGALTIDVRCAARCAVRYVAAGPAIAHAEGHIAFAAS
jgi:hypothetical protein